MARSLRQLPLLLEEGPDLAWRAFPFIPNLEEARRLMAAYRAAGFYEAASLPAALSLGLLSEEAAVLELFQDRGGEERRLDKGLILNIGGLLLTDGGRELFRRNLLSFSGVIEEDADGDGYSEALARYREGSLTGYEYDVDQDGLPELNAVFEAGLPCRVELAALPGFFTAGEPLPFAVLPLSEGDRIRALIHWEQYPVVLESTLEGVRYIPRSRDFFYAPFRLEDLGGTGLLFPGGDPRRMGLSQRTLLAFAAALERPSREFAGAVERFELNRGIPERAQEFLNGRLVAETEFSQGRPVLQRLDLDLDGRLETVRRFREAGGGESLARSPYDVPGLIEFSGSDWDGDGVIETGEEYVFGEAGGGIIRSWDLDRDGIRETRVRY
jgi:hypothetical protein